MNKPGYLTTEFWATLLMNGVAILAALGKENELAMHIRATRNTGATADDIKEVMLMVAAYAGVPAANAAIGVAKRAYAEMEQQD